MFGNRKFEVWIYMKSGNVVHLPKGVCTELHVKLQNGKVDSIDMSFDAKLGRCHSIDADQIECIVTRRRW